MIRSSKHSLKDCNPGKQTAITGFVSRYRDTVQKYVNILWNDFRDEGCSYLPSNVCNSIDSGVEIDARIRQCAAAQACAMVNGTMIKHRKRLFVLGKLQRESEKDTKYLQRKIDCFPPSKPNADKVNPVLDSRFVDFQETEDGHFDMFVRVSQLGDKEEITIPLVYNKVSNKWRELGERKGSIRLGEKNVTLFFEVPDVPKRKEGRVLGADQGMLTALTLSDGQATQKDCHGHDLSSICAKLSRREKGSKGFEQAQSHRTNYTNWSINQLNFNGVKKVNLERIFNLRKGKSSSRKLSHWAYTGIKTKLVRLSEVEGFDLVEQDNKFRSQRCSKCGWVHKSNRKGKTFKCTSVNCDFVADADLNAASNHETELCDVSRAWLDHLNRGPGFYWMKDGLYDRGGEPIVPRTKKE